MKRSISIISSNPKRSSLLSMLRQTRPEMEHKGSGDLKEGMKLIYEAKHSILFLDHTFDERMLLSLLGLSSKCAKSAKTILLIPSHEAGDSRLSQLISIGFTGVLMEPFSHDSLDEALEISHELNKKGSFARLTVATKMQIGAMFNKETPRSRNDNIVEHISGLCKNFEQQNPGVSVKKLTEELGAMAPVDRLNHAPGVNYTGVSKRVREIVTSLQHPKKNK